MVHRRLQVLYAGVEISVAQAKLFMSLLHRVALVDDRPTGDRADLGCQHMLDTPETGIGEARLYPLVLDSDIDELGREAGNIVLAAKRPIQAVIRLSDLRACHRQQARAGDRHPKLHQPRLRRVTSRSQKWIAR